MIRVTFDPEKLEGQRKTEWDAWLARATKARGKIIKEWEQKGKITSKSFDSEIWKDLKEWLLEYIFNGKCAYCETNIKEARQYGDAEHFRPKGGVSPEEVKETGFPDVQVVHPDGTTIHHPGYFWLAYDWKNLLPACSTCNREGKQNKFPVEENKNVLTIKLTSEDVSKLKAAPYASKKWEGVYYLQPDDLDAIEQPYLLHPYFGDDPRNHICFDDFGKVFEKIDKSTGKKSVLAEKSISVYHLDDDSLTRARNKAQIAGESDFKLAWDYHKRFGHCTLPVSKKKAWDDMDDALKGKIEYSAAILDYIALIYQVGSG